MNDRGDFKNNMQHDIVNQFDLLDLKWESKLEEMQHKSKTESLTSTMKK